MFLQKHGMFSKCSKAIKQIHSHQHFLHFSMAGLNTQQFSHRVIYGGKGVVFFAAVKVRDSISREAEWVFIE